MITVARLDDKNRLIGYRRVAKKGKNHIVVPTNCDLPTDGSYRWDGKCFVPRGHGYGQPSRPPIMFDYAVYLMMKALIREKLLPAECEAYVEWYQKNLAQRRNGELAS